MFKSRTQWHCGNCSQCIDRRFATVASGCSQYDRVTDYVSDVFTGPRKDRYQKNIAVDYVRHGVELQRWLAQTPALWGLRSPEGILWRRRFGARILSSIMPLHKHHYSPVVTQFADVAAGLSRQAECPRPNMAA